jgi:hypothetical protein
MPLRSELGYYTNLRSIDSPNILTYSPSHSHAIPLLSVEAPHLQRLLSHWINPLSML